MSDPRRFLIILPALILALMADVSCQVATTIPQWKVRYVHAEIYDDPGTEFWLRALDGRIVGFSEGKRVLDIGGASVAAVVYDDQMFRPLRDWLIAGAVLAPSVVSMSKGGCSGWGDCAFPIPPDVNRGVGIAIAGTWLFSAIMGSRIYHDHYIGLFWRENNILHQALFRVEKQDMRAILDALSQTTEKPVIDLAERRAALRDEIHAHKAEAASLTIDREMTMSGVRLRPGEFRVLVLPREEQYVEVDLFRGKDADISHLAAQSWAQGILGAQPVGGEQVEIHTEDRADVPSSIYEFVVGSKTYALRESIPENHEVTFAAFLKEETTPVLNVALKGRTSQVDLITYKGERAFRFPVQHQHARWLKREFENCAGNLIVMKDRVIFDAAFNLNGDRDPFELDRTQITRMESIKTPSNWAALHLETAKRKYDLAPYFGVPSDQMGLMTRRTVRQALAPELDLFDEVVSDFNKALEKYGRTTVPAQPPQGNV
jgi:hypothetical protein